jgi:hypothetical protein
MSRDDNASTQPEDAANAHFTPIPGGRPVMLSDHAREMGRQELPRTTAVEANDFETAIIRQHQQEHTTLLERARKALAGLGAEFERAEKQLPRPGDARLEAGRALEAVQHGLAQQRPIALLLDEANRRLRDLRVFVRRNRLGRDAHYPESSRLTLAMLLLFIVVESALNMAFFGQGSEIGMLGGFFIAASISSINVLSAYFMGKSARYLNHLDAWRRACAAAGLVAYIVVMVVFHLAIGHYRDLLSVSGVSTRDSLGALARGPFDLSMNSYLLVCAGLLAAILAAVKGYLSDDPYPGYGGLDRRHRDARQAYEESRQLGYDRLSAPVRAIPAACDTRVAAAAQVLESLRATHVAASRIAHEYDAGRAHLEDRCRVFLKEYREENCLIRTTQPPAYFAEFPSFGDELDRSRLSAMEDRIRFAEEATERLRAEAGEVKTANRELLAETSRRFDDEVAGQIGQLEDEARRADREAEAELQGERRAS